MGNTISANIEYKNEVKTLASLLEDVNRGYLDTTYIAQRAPFQWTNEQVNRYLSRILNNQPVPEFVICTLNENGINISYLVEGLQRITYAMEFRQNRLVCKANGAEFTDIVYREFSKDENGNFIYDEEGKKVTEEHEFDIIGKHYSELPDFLKKRFDDYNLRITTFLDCTQEMINYQLRSYNSTSSMSKNDYAITTASNEVIKRIKEIAHNNEFFKNNIVCSAVKETKGGKEETVISSMMTLYYTEDWSKDIKKRLRTISENATEKEFNNLKDILDSLEEVCTEEARELFTTVNAPILFVLFNRCRKYGVSNVEFINFLEKFAENLSYIKEIEKANKLAIKEERYDDTKELSNDFISKAAYQIYTDRHTTNKDVVFGKIDMLEKMLKEYLNIKESAKETEVKAEVNSVADFVRENVTEEITDDDVEFMELCLDEYMIGSVPSDSALRENANRNSMVAIVAYANKEQIDDFLEEWLEEYAGRIHTYTEDQVRNYILMRSDFKFFIKKKRGDAA